MRDVQIYFEMEKKAFTPEIAMAVISAFVSKYKLDKISMQEEAHRLYNEGDGGSIFFVKLPYNALIIEAQSSKRYRRVPPDRLYVYMSCDRTNFENQDVLDMYVADAVMLYHILKPDLGVGGIEDFFEEDGTHFLRELSVYPLMFLNANLIKRMGGLKKILELKKHICEVRQFDDGGVMLRLSTGSPRERGTSESETRVAATLGIMSDWNR